MEERILLEDNRQFEPFKTVSFASEEDKDILRRFYDEITGLIIDTQKSVRNNFISLGWALYRLRESGLYAKYYNFNSLSNYFIGNTNCFYDVCYDYFHLRKSSVKAYIEVCMKFGLAGDIKPEYENYSYSALVEMCSLPDEKLSDITSTMTVKEIRSYKSGSQTSGQNCKAKKLDSVREELSEQDKEKIDLKLLKTVFIQYVKEYMEEYSYQLYLHSRKQSPKVFAGSLFNHLNDKGFFEELL